MKTTDEQSIAIRLMKSGKTKLELAKESGVNYQNMARRIRSNKLSAEYKRKIEPVLKKWGV